MPPTNIPPTISLRLQSPEARRVLLFRKLGKSWASILAGRLKCDASLISHVVAGRRTNRAAQRAIAKAIGEAPEVLFENQVEATTKAVIWGRRR